MSKTSTLAPLGAFTVPSWCPFGVTLAPLDPFGYKAPFVIAYDDTYYLLPPLLQLPLSLLRLPLMN